MKITTDKKALFNKGDRITIWSGKKGNETVIVMSSNFDTFTVRDMKWYERIWGYIKSFFYDSVK